VGKHLAGLKRKDTESAQFFFGQKVLSVDQGGSFFTAHKDGRYHKIHKVDQLFTEEQAVQRTAALYGQALTSVFRL
jgi:hypothetical protein